METILVIDDNIGFLGDVRTLLGSHFEVLTASTAKRGLDIVRTNNVSAVLLDIMLPDINGIEVLKTIHRELAPHLPVIIVTDNSDVALAVEAMQAGAYDFMPKGFNPELLKEKIYKAMERRRLELSVGVLQRSFEEQHDRMVLASDKIKRVNFELTRLAQLDFDVLLLGETGVGKDLSAFEIHRRSRRANKPFVAISMRALSDSLIESELFGHEKGAFSGADKAKIGKFESANGGTVYIPEVSSLSESVQLKLLLFFQYKTITRVGQDPRKPETRLDVRMIMASNDNLEDLVAKGQLRSDFYHRISGVSLSIPPLRERQDDIEPLAKYFLHKHNGNEGDVPELSEEVLDEFCKYHWPGNVRELENWMKSALVYSSESRLTIEDFPHLKKPESIQNHCANCLGANNIEMPSLHKAESEFKRAYFQEILKRANNNIPEAAKLAGITPQGFRKSLTTLDIDKKDT
jgi:two-component system, NtrC family, response regulator AtoC